MQWREKQKFKRRAVKPSGSQKDLQEKVEEVIKVYETGNKIESKQQDANPST